MAGHTNGPWFVIEDRPPAQNVVWADEATVIADCGYGSIPVEKREANMRLIAAAPDLLAACKKAMVECCDLIETDAGNAIRDAVAKAEGKIK